MNDEPTGPDAPIQIAEQSRELRHALDGADAGTWQVDFRSNTVRWDDRSRALFGAEGLSQSFDAAFAAVHPDDRARLQQRLGDLQRPGDDRWEMTFRVEHPRGAIRWIHSVGRMERDQGGRPIALTGINRNVTAEKMAEDELSRSQAQHAEAAELIERLLDGAAQGILVATRAGVIERANAALEAMFGYAPGELAGEALERLIPQAVRARHAHQHAAFWTAPRSRPMGQNLDLAGQRKDGTTLPVEVSLTH
ncbi:MAG: PAS domain-containing protein, partial [Vicinamibacterales bacterium]